MGSRSIAVRLTDEGIPTQTVKPMWRQSYVHHVLGNATYTGTWVYGKSRHMSTEDGMKVYDQPRDAWIEIPFPQLINDETWERVQKMKKQRSSRAKRNTKVVYLLQHLLRCGECGRRPPSTPNRARTIALPCPYRPFRCCIVIPSVDLGLAGHFR